MLEQLEYIKKWASQDFIGWTGSQVARAVVRMCDDALLERAVELPDAPEMTSSPINEDNTNEPCHTCKGKCGSQTKSGWVECYTCGGDGKAK